MHRPAKFFTRCLLAILLLSALVLFYFYFTHFFHLELNYQNFSYRNMPHTVQEHGIEKYFKTQSAGELSKLRSDLRRFIWGSPELPKLMPLEQKISEDLSCHSLFAKDLLPTKTLVIKQTHGINSLVAFFSTHSSARQLAIYHHGHVKDFCQNRKLLQSLLEQGFDVLALNMPLRGQNPQPMVELADFGVLQLTQHEYLKFLHPVHGHPVQYLLNPVLAALNWAQNQATYQRIIMLGISGGGWTTTMMAALDPRISASYEIAGSYPMYLRFASQRDWGDWEQTIPELYEIADYLDLYLLASWQRRHVQILNQYDDCCFAGVNSLSYSSTVQKRVQALDAKSSFETIIDTSHFKHAISKFAQKYIINDLQNTLKKNP